MSDTQRGQHARFGRAIGVITGVMLLSVSAVTPAVFAEGDVPPVDEPAVEEPAAVEPTAPPTTSPPTTVVVAVAAPPVAPGVDDDGNAVAVGAPPVPPGVDDGGNAVAVGAPPVTTTPASASSPARAVQPATLVNRPVPQIDPDLVLQVAVRYVANRLDLAAALR